MNRICLFIAILLSGVTFKTFSQTAQIKLDSLLAIDRTYLREDSTKFVLLKNILIQYSRLQNDQKVEEIGTKAIRLANKLHQPALEGDLYYRLGLYYHGSNRYLKAEQNYFKSIEKYTLANDLSWVAGNYQSLGALYTNIPDYSKALEANQKVISIFKIIGDESDFANIYTNIAILYQNLGQQSESLSYLKRSLKEYLKDGDTNRGVAIVYSYIGNAYQTASDQELQKMGVSLSQKNELSLANFNKSLAIARAINEQRLSSSLLGKIGAIQEQNNDKIGALKSYQEALALSPKLESSKNYAYSLTNLAMFFHRQKDFKKAEILLNEALEIGKDNNLIDLLRDTHEQISLNEEQLLNYNDALTHYKKYISFRDQIFNEEKEKEITRKRMQLDFSIKEKDYQIEQRLTASLLQTQVLLAKQQQHELALSDKEKSLQRLTFLKRQADLENEKIEQELSAKLDKEIKDKKINLQESEIKFNKKIAVVLGVLAILLFAVAIFVYNMKRKTARLNTVISEQKLALEKLSMVKDRIFSVVGHDMRSPVNSLISFIQLLEDGHIDQQKLTRYASNLKQTLGYTSAMMENLLNWASSQMQGFKPKLENFDLQLCAKEVVAGLQVSAELKSITLINHITSTTICYADMNMTTLVLRNLISNAIKFTKEGGKVELLLTESNQQLLIAVKDTGVGLSPQDIAHFNDSPHKQGTSIKNTRGTNQEKGSGLGLMLCQTFTALMNGSLHVLSEQNVGTVFTLTLPKTA